MAQLILLVVAAAWLAVLIPPMLRSRVENRPNSSVTDFRRQLTKLQNTATHRRVERCVQWAVRSLSLRCRVLQLAAAPGNLSFAPASPATPLHRSWRRRRTTCGRPKLWTRRRGSAATVIRPAVSAARRNASSASARYRRIIRVASAVNESSATRRAASTPDSALASTRRSARRLVDERTVTRAAVSAVHRTTPARSVRRPSSVA